MTTTTDAGLAVVADLLIGVSNATVDTVAVGTGTGNESASATSLTNEQFRATTSDPNVDARPGDSDGTVEFAIEVTAGVDVPVGTQFTEIAAFFNGGGGGGEMLVIDEFPAITVEGGDIERFTIPFDATRGVID